MQKGVDQVPDSCDNYDFTISIKKTEVVYQPAPGKPYKEPTITAKGQRLQVVDKFTYLGSTLSRVVHIDDEVNARIAKASAAFGRLRGSVWDRSGIKLDTKLKVYKAVVLPTLLYACETWTVYQRHTKRLNHFHTSCIRKLLKIKWQDRIPDTEVLKRAGMQSVHTLLKLAQLRWTGHVTRMHKERLPKKILYGELEMGKRSHGGQKDTKTSSKPPSRISTYQQCRGNKLHRTEQSGETSSEEVLVNMRQKESAKPSRNVHSAKPELRHHQQSCLALTSVVPSATDSLELELV